MTEKILIQKKSGAVSANLVMRLHRASKASVLQAKQFLEQFPTEEQLKYVEIAESKPNGNLHDPIQDDPNIRPIFESICTEAKEIAEAQWQPILSSSPRRGFIHFYWSIIKRLLWERYQIEWRSPAELNTWIHYS
jgi:hypothetical protein